MKRCSVTENLEIVQGGIEDYERLGCFHYRGGKLGPWCRIFAIRPAIGVIVYKMPVPALELRNIALGGVFKDLSNDEKLQIINNSIRCISRVIIDPRYRGLGLAAKIVKETMPLLGVPIIEALAVMGSINPFFKKAGMTEYQGPCHCRNVQLVEAFSLIGLSETELIDPPAVEKKIQSLGRSQKNFIRSQMHLFLQAYGKRRDMPEGAEKIRFILNRLTDRPRYYIKFLDNC